MLAAACADVDYVEESAPHVHDSFAPQRPPILPSGPLGHETHTPFERVKSRALLPGPRRIHQKVLLLTADENQPSYLAARDALVRMGVPFQAVNAVNQEITEGLLADRESTCFFNSVIFATSGLGYADPNLGWTSALSTEEWARIAAFETACSAREAVWYAWPSPDLGLTYVSSFSWNEPTTGKIANPSFFKRVPSEARLSFHYAAGYRAAVTGPSTTPLVTDTNGNVLLATHTRPDGTEVLVSTVDGSPYLPHSLVLEYDMIRWLTRGVFVGQKQTYLAPQIDDIFMSNDMWRLDLHSNPEDDTHTFRISGADLTKVAARETALKARMPAGSTFRTAMAYNAIGTTTEYTSDKTLVNAAKALGSKFQWLSHTYDHENMDAMSRANAKNEITSNCTRGQSLLLSGLVCNEVVTPDMSGLANINAVRGMLDGGVRFVVSDTSRVASDPHFAANPGDNPSFNVGRFSTLDARLYHIPRHPTNVFYDVKDRVDMVDSYNTRFPGSNVNYEQVLDLNTSWPLLYLLQGDIDPLMFHQANLYAYDSAGRSLYSDFLETLMGKYFPLSKAPVLTLTQRAIGEAMQRRGELDACNAKAVIVESSTGRSLQLTSTATCTVPVTGIAAPTKGTVQSYAGESITSVKMPTGGGTVTIPL